MNYLDRDTFGMYKSHDEKDPGSLANGCRYIEGQRCL